MVSSLKHLVIFSPCLKKGRFLQIAIFNSMCYLSLLHGYTETKLHENANLPQFLNYTSRNLESSEVQIC